MFGLRRWKTSALLFRCSRHHSRAKKLILVCFLELGFADLDIEELILVIELIDAVGFEHLWIRGGRSENGD